MFVSPQPWEIIKPPAELVFGAADTVISDAFILQAIYFGSVVKNSGGERPTILSGISFISAGRYLEMTPLFPVLRLLYFVLFMKCRFMIKMYAAAEEGGQIKQQLFQLRLI